MSYPRCSFLLLLLAIMAAVPAQAQLPENYYNDPENLDLDPNYVPGDYALPEVFASKTTYHLKKTELLEAFTVAESRHLYTLGLGDITFRSWKNETVPIAGSFHHYTGVLRMGANGPEILQMVIDVNSLDTGVPGRNNRILDIFFQSTQPAFGSVMVEFQQFDLGGKEWVEFRNGLPHALGASGTITLNGKIQSIEAMLEVTFEGGTWSTKTREPLELLLSDFAFGDRIYALIKACNHKALGNSVAVQVDLSWR